MRWMGTTSRPTAKPTSPPTTASTKRGTDRSRTGGSRVAMSTAVPPAWVSREPPPLSRMATMIASTTTRPVCQGPMPKSGMTASPTASPRTTPTSSSMVRRRRVPIEAATMPTAVVGASTGEGLSRNWSPTNQASSPRRRPARRAARIGGTARRGSATRTAPARAGRPGSVDPGHPCGAGRRQLPAPAWRASAPFTQRRRIYPASERNRAGVPSVGGVRRVREFAELAPVRLGDVDTVVLGGGRMFWKARSRSLSVTPCT